MNCASVDLKGYALGEASAEERRAVELHVKACSACHEELLRLDVTRAALMTLRDEEMPRRIAFVSDKVFEPKWYERLFGSAKLGFASAAVLAGAILGHGVITRPPAPVTVVQSAPPPVTKQEPVNWEGTFRELNRQSEQQAAARIAALEKRMEQRQRETQVFVETNFEVLSRRVQNLQRETMSASAVETGGGAR